MTLTSLDLPVEFQVQPYYDRLKSLLIHHDLDFHEQGSAYASHNFHSFPAKFPPQIPALFIQSLTERGDLILDPMQGSGTTLLEAVIAGRRGLGFDIDPLAVLITGVKITPQNALALAHKGNEIANKARKRIREYPEQVFQALEKRWDAATRDFVDYWFDTTTQIELMALRMEIEQIEDFPVRRFFDLAFSAIIITKSGGVSLARDLAHTRPHRAKLIYSQSGEILEGAELLEPPPRNLPHITKRLKPAIVEFEKRVQSNLSGLLPAQGTSPPAHILFGNAQHLSLAANCVDLIVTSPPYASNAIDYMRAHKFSLAWLGYPLGDLGEKRKEYIGGEAVPEAALEPLPEHSADIVAEISALDQRKGKVLHFYYSDMSRVLREMFRVLKPGKAALVVVGTSEMRGKDTETQNCLAEIGKMHGFRVPAIGVRNLDRNRRMMPAGENIDRESQIQKRMHEEFVIGFYKPE